MDLVSYLQSGPDYRNPNTKSWSGTPAEISAKKEKNIPNSIRSENNLE